VPDPALLAIGVPEVLAAVETLLTAWSRRFHELTKRDRGGG
jgi:hypothetical protein